MPPLRHAVNKEPLKTEQINKSPRALACIKKAKANGADQVVHYLMITSLLMPQFFFKKKIRVTTLKIKPGPNEFRLKVFELPAPSNTQY